MIVGISFTAYYIIAVVFFGMQPWTFGILEQELIRRESGCSVHCLIYSKSGIDAILSTPAQIPTDDRHDS